MKKCQHFNVIKKGFYRIRIAHNLWAKFGNHDHSARGGERKYPRNRSFMHNFEQDFLSYVSTHIICVTYLEFYNSVLCALEEAKKTFQLFESVQYFFFYISSNGLKSQHILSLC